MQPSPARDQYHAPSLTGLMVALNKNEHFYLRPLPEPTGQILMSAPEPPPAK